MRRKRLFTALTGIRDEQLRHELIGGLLIVLLIAREHRFGLHGGEFVGEEELLSMHRVHMIKPFSGGELLEAAGGCELDET
jgi:hypothetical protein